MRKEPNSFFKFLFGFVTIIMASFAVTYALNSYAEGRQAQAAAAAEALLNGEP